MQISLGHRGHRAHKGRSKGAAHIAAQGQQGEQKRTSPGNRTGRDTETARPEDTHRKTADAAAQKT